jgi:MFS family permease
LFIGVPLCLIIRRSPESMGLRPDGDDDTVAPGARQDPNRNLPVEVDVSAGQAIRTFAFWAMIVGAAVRNASYHAISTHFIPLMVWKGMSQEQAALLLGAFAFFGFTSTIVFGWLADTANKPRMVSLILFAAAGSMFLPLFANSMGFLLIFVLIFTAVESTYPIAWAMVGDLFGRRHFAKIRGYMSIFYVWGSVAGPVIAGAIYDRTQTYEPMLWMLVGSFSLASLFYGVIINLGRRLAPPCAHKLTMTSRRRNVSFNDSRAKTQRPRAPATGRGAGRHCQRLVEQTARRIH